MSGSVDYCVRSLGNRPAGRSAATHLGSILRGWFVFVSTPERRSSNQGRNPVVQLGSGLFGHFLLVGGRNTTALVCASFLLGTKSDDLYYRQRVER